MKSFFNNAFLSNRFTCIRFCCTRRTMQKEIVNTLNEMITSLQVDSEFLKDVTHHLVTMSETIKQQSETLLKQQEELGEIKDRLDKAQEELQRAKEEIGWLQISLDEHENKSKQKSCILCRLTS